MTVTSKQPLEIAFQQQIFQIENNYLADLSKRINSYLQIDRLFICAKQGEKATSILRQLGLYCPSTVVQSKSQGTLSQIFFFQNIYVAIIWLKDDYQHSNTIIDFAARVNWQDSHTSPFGVGLSRKENVSELDQKKYPVDDLVINNYIAYSQQNQKNGLEPLIFMLPDHLRYCNILNRGLPQYQRYTNHPLGVKNITNIKISVQKGKRRDSEIIGWAKYNQLLEIGRDSQPLLELTFDHGARREVFDARPILPTIFRY